MRKKNQNEQDYYSTTPHKEMAKRKRRESKGMRKEEAPGRVNVRWTMAMKSPMRSITDPLTYSLSHALRSSVNVYTRNENNK